MTQHKTCTKCGESKPTSEFPLCTLGGKYGVRSECKPCRAEAQKAARTSRKARERAKSKLEAAARKAELEAAAASTKALPRTFNTIKDPTPWVPVDRTYYRNGGNKHIQSRGF